jgi:hypothetical protein
MPDNRTALPASRRQGINMIAYDRQRQWGVIVGDQTEGQGVRQVTII